MQTWLIYLRSLTEICQNWTFKPTVPDARIFNKYLHAHWKCFSFIPGETMGFGISTRSEHVYQRLITYSRKNFHLQLKLTLLMIYFINPIVQTIIFRRIISRSVLYNLWKNLNYKYRFYMTSPSIYVSLSQQWSAKCEL